MTDQTSLRPRVRYAAGTAGMRHWRNPPTPTSAEHCARPAGSQERAARRATERRPGRARP